MNKRRRYKAKARRARRLCLRNGESRHERQARERYNARITEETAFWRAFDLRLRDAITLLTGYHAIRY